ncbi:type II toxin-antitoxin system RelB/DinJ family antitoxin [Levilactobacillus enshiensis]|uniref:type II toxin-antitoxin system RelB/DinJ family antitoxin n=1 Tax=Levilactobacillus enshiensis TaxID=2590213 RepID=UPI00117BB7E8|nr:type II toxin-antitoxin system RelB/DinJ family antitoxin [Levilactobacillus enshiensis]
MNKRQELQTERVSTRISKSVKVKAQANLEKRGLTIAEYMRIVLSSVAENGLPTNFGQPNQEVLDSIHEMIDAKANDNLLPGGTVEEFERKLNS